MPKIVIGIDSMGDAEFVARQIQGLGGEAVLLQDGTGCFYGLVAPVGLENSALASLLAWAGATGRFAGEACDPGPAGPVAEMLCRLAAGCDPGGLATRTLLGIGAK